MSADANKTTWLELRQEEMQHAGGQLPAGVSAQLRTTT